MNRNRHLMMIKQILIEINSEVSLYGTLSLQFKSNYLIIFVHGSGSTASSSRNQIVARSLNASGFSTLLFDLLTNDEQEADSNAEKIRGKVPGIILNKFNIELLTARLDAVTQWVQSNHQTKELEIGYFAASTGAAAALYAASSFSQVKAVVCRGGRTDLVNKESLSEIKCPCLFITGGNDGRIIKINKTSLKHLTNVKKKKLEIIEGASHLFEEEGKMNEVAKISNNWFKIHLT